MVRPVAELLHFPFLPRTRENFERKRNGFRANIGRPLTESQNPGFVAADSRQRDMPDRQAFELFDSLKPAVHRENHTPTPFDKLPIARVGALLGKRAGVLDCRLERLCYSHSLACLSSSSASRRSFAASVSPPRTEPRTSGAAVKKSSSLSQYSSRFLRSPGGDVAMYRTQVAWLARIESRTACGTTALPIIPWIAARQAGRQGNEVAL